MTAYHLAALPPTLLLLAEPTLWPWSLAVIGFVALAAVGAAAHRFRDERDEARTNAARLEAEANAHAAENARLTTELAARGPRLRVVEGGIPSQRTGGHDHLAEDDDWFARLYDEKGNPR
jgi:hypothetical protein